MDEHLTTERLYDLAVARYDNIIQRNLGLEIELAQLECLLGIFKLLRERN